MADQDTNVDVQVPSNDVATAQARLSTNPSNSAATSPEPTAVTSQASDLSSQNSLQADHQDDVDSLQVRLRYILFLSLIFYKC